MKARTEKNRLFNQANEEWDAGRKKRALELFMQAAKLGDVYSYNSVGYFYDIGIAVRADKNKALRWYKKAARKGETVACLNIGTIYRDKKNFARAKFWFLKALSMGDGDAALEIAKLYLGKANIPKVLKYLRIVISSKHVTEASKEEASHLLNKIRNAATK